MGIDCNGTCSTTCFGCSTMCAYYAEYHISSGCSSMDETSSATSDAVDEKIKSIPTECSSCGAQTEVKQMVRGFLYIKECPYCGRKEVVSIK